MSARVAILTVSDTAFQDQHADKSGPFLKQQLIAWKYDCPYQLIVPDEVEDIRSAVRKWCAQGDVDWVITTGGTGFGVRDRTPEAISPLIERPAPGLVHLMLSASLKSTPLAALSRPVAGTVGKTLVVTFPGSVKAVRENLETLIVGGVVAHALDLIKGGSGKDVHSKLAQTTASDVAVSGHHHHHHLHEHSHHVPQPRSTILSHDPSQPVSTRHRESPYPLVTIDEAFVQIMKEVKTLPASEEPVSSRLRGHVLAEDVFAPQDVPSSFTTSVDGYALRSTDPPGVYKVLTPQTHKISSELPSDSIYRINTGAPLPAGADTVIMVEDTLLHSTFKDNEGNDTEEKEVKTLVQVPTKDNIRNPGSDTKKGDLVLEKGHVLRSVGGEIGTLAFVGRSKVKVYKKPVVAIMSTGNELLDLQAPRPMSVDGWGGIWDTNRPSLQAALEGMGYQVIDLGIVPDDLDSHVSLLQKGLEVADIILTTGGTSMGASDLLKPVIERHLGGTIHFGRVKTKPGKPTTFATIPRPGHTDNTPIPMFALPGNPASALVTFHVFAVPALRKLGGWPIERCHLPRVRVQLQHSMRLDPRPEFHRVIIKAGLEGLKAYSTGGQRSSRVASLSGANGLVMLPVREENRDSVKAGETVDAMVIGELEME